MHTCAASGISVRLLLLRGVTSPVIGFFRTGDRRLKAMLTPHHSPLPLLPSFPAGTCSRMSLLRHDVVSRSDWSFPSSHTHLPAIYPFPMRDHAQSAAALPGGRMLIPTRLPLKNYATLTMTSHFTCTKGVTAHLYGGTYKQYGGIVLRWLFDDYHFLVLLLATSLTMAVSYRVETSHTRPPYHSPRRHDSKIPHFI